MEGTRVYELGPGAGPMAGPPPLVTGQGLKQLLYVLGKWKAIIALVVVGAVGATGFFALFVLPKVYQSSATVDVTALLAPQGTGQGGGGGAGLQGAVTQATTQPTATMPTLLWTITSPANLTAAAKILSPHGSGGLGGSVSASQISGTNLITVSATSHNPQQAAAIANAVAQAFATSESASTSGTVAQGLTKLEQEAATVKARLATASQNLAKAEQEPGAAASTKSEISADNAQIASLSGQLSTAEVALQAAVAAQNAQASQLQGVPATISSTSNASASATAQANPQYQSLTSQLNTDEVQLATDKAKAQQLYQQTLQYNYAVEPSAYLAAKQAYQSAEVTVAGDQAAIQAVQNELAQTPSTLAPSSQSAPAVTVSPNPQYQQLEQALHSQQVTVAQDEAQVAQIQKMLPPLEQSVSSLESQSTAADSTLSAAQSQVDSLTQTYQTLETNITNAQISQALSVNGGSVRIEAPAGVPGAPISPKKKTDLALAFLVGLVAGCALAFILEQFDNTIKTPEDVRRVVGLPTLAVVPMVRS